MAAVVVQDVKDAVTPLLDKTVYSAEETTGITRRLAGVANAVQAKLVSLGMDLADTVEWPRYEEVVIDTCVFWFLTDAGLQTGSIKQASFYERYNKLDKLLNDELGPIMDADGNILGEAGFVFRVLGLTSLSDV